MSGLESALLVLWSLQCAYSVAACLIAAREMSAQARRTARASTFPDVSVLIPAFNEVDCIADCLASIRASSLQPAAIIVIDDGSSDATAAIAATALFGDPSGRVVCLRKNSGKAAALNVGLAEVATEFVFTLDADSRLDPGALFHVCGAMVEDRLDAAACHVAIAPGFRGLAACQRAEYVGSLQLSRLMQAQFDAITTVPGAGGLFRTAALREAGGIPARTRAEDTDLTLLLQRAGSRVGCCAEALIWTDPPRGLAPLLRQRRRWLCGNLAAGFFHLADQGRREPRFVLLILPWLILSNGISPIFFCVTLILAPWLFLAGDSNPAVLVGACLAGAVALTRMLFGYRISGFERPRMGEILGCLVIIPWVNTLATASGLLGALAPRSSTSW